MSPNLPIHGTRMLEYDQNIVESFADRELAGSVQQANRDMDYDYDIRRPHEYLITQ